MTKIEKANQVLQEFTESLASKIQNEEVDIDSIKDQLAELKPHIDKLQVFESAEVIDKINNMPQEISDRCKDQNERLWPEFEKAYETQDMGLIQSIARKSMAIAKQNFEDCGIYLDSSVYDAMQIMSIAGIVLLKRLGITAKEMFQRNMQLIAC